MASKYLIERLTQSIQKLLRPHLDANVDVQLAPPEVGADFAVPLFRHAKGQSPALLGEELANKLEGSAKKAGFQEISSKGGFLNFTLDQSYFIEQFHQDFVAARGRYGASQSGRGKTILLEYSSPNIAKPFSVGHLRSTVIGQALKNIYAFLGYHAVGINYLGDWGTQFGKLIAAYHRWGVEEKKMEQAPIKTLLDLYVRFSAAEESDPRLAEEARHWFKRLEEGDPAATGLWKRFRILSVKDFKRLYKLLGVEFDAFSGESAYNKKLTGVVRLALARGVATRDPDGSIIIPLEKAGIELPLLIQKSDGASLYATRDLAAAIDRLTRFKPREMLYVVGGEQQLYFRQLNAALALLGYGRVPLKHVWFGLLRLPEGKMSTRKGRVIFLEDLLAEAMERAKGLITQTRLSAREREKVARVVGIGAIKYADLSHHRTRDILFSWERMLALDGSSAPYLQYSYARAKSILRKVKSGAKFEAARLCEPEALALVKKMALWPTVLERARAEAAPHFLAEYLFALAQIFSRFYEALPVRDAKASIRGSRLFLVQAYSEVIRSGLALLGIDVLEKM